MPTSKKRTYRSEYRRQQATAQAETTEDRILGAARKLFGAGGYGSTTIEEIAREAGLAVQTVYARFTSKRNIVMGVFERAEREGSLREIAAAFEASQDPLEMLTLGVAFNRTFYPRTVDVYRILVGAAAVDPVIADLEPIYLEQRRARCASIVRGWASIRGLRVGLSERDATSVMFALTGPEIFELLVTRSGWSPEEYESWLLRTLWAELEGSLPQGAAAVSGQEAPG